MPVDPKDLETCLRVLATFSEDLTRVSELDKETRVRLHELAGRVSRPTRDEARKLQKAQRKKDRANARARDAQRLLRTLNREARRSSTFVLPGSTVDFSYQAPLPAEEVELERPRDCYVCKESYRRLHHFYDSLCPKCAELNWQKRHQTARLDGRIALITGARIKIGYQAALMLLRAGAQVIATTRFPRDAAVRFSREPDFAEWSERLSLRALELRDIPAVERFAEELERTLPRLDLLINNAAQTVRRPPAFYRSLIEAELAAAGQLSPAAHRLLLGEGASPTALVPAWERALVPLSERELREFPPGALDLDEQQVDLRAVNSWRLKLGEVSTVELVEVHLVNAIAPFVLTSKLRPLMQRDRTDEKHVVNVSAMEAKFGRNKKTDKHPHTNMAKAALNMLTRTSAQDFVNDGIFMNSVDTGWVTDEDPLHHVARKQDEHDFHPPLDAIDGAARVCDPIFSGLLSGHHPWGLFLKDYRPVTW